MSDTPKTDEVAAHEGNWDTKALRMTRHAQQLERELNKLQDPTAVHVNMLRGTIAKPSVDHILHLYPELKEREGDDRIDSLVQSARPDRPQRGDFDLADLRDWPF